MPPMPDGDPGRRRADRRGPLQLRRRARTGRRKRATILFSGQRHSAAPRRRPPSSPSTTTSAPSCGRRRATSAARGRPRRPSAGTACTRQQERRAPLVTELLGRVRGPDRRRHRLHDDRARADRPLPARPLVQPARHRRHGPLRHPRGAAPLLRGRHRPRRRRRARRPRSPTATSKPAVVNDAIARYDIDPEAVDPFLG